MAPCLATRKLTTEPVLVINSAAFSCVRPTKLLPSTSSNWSPACNRPSWNQINQWLWNTVVWNHKLRRMKIAQEDLPFLLEIPLEGVCSLRVMRITAVGHHWGSVITTLARQELIMSKLTLASRLNILTYQSSSATSYNGLDVDASFLLSFTLE
jgi:hypothetical protein